ncbi:hypothetical protein [Neobacillus niacini]|uniref:hypothetical protein n=1 Tax=Neobacillus niacini TaxID=86668 RepID=UPI0021CB3FF2|nr:hypothetical protein [Neobacillus niacini]MCM3767893.1 hypothetical protein [Neobacillus niacini]
MGIDSVKQVIPKEMSVNIHFGEVNIHQITGHLNIGTTYEGDISEIIEEKLKQMKWKIAEKANN